MNNSTLYLEATYGLQVPEGETREPRGPAEVRMECGAQGAAGWKCRGKIT